MRTNPPWAASWLPCGAGVDGRGAPPPATIVVGVVTVGWAVVAPPSGEHAASASSEATAKARRRDRIVDMRGSSWGEGGVAGTSGRRGRGAAITAAPTDRERRNGEPTGASFG